MSQYCTFSVGTYFFGIPVDQVQEVVRHQAMSPVPLAPLEVRGLINLRGQIITAIDLRRRLRLAPGDNEDRTMNVLLKTSDGAVSLLVDQIEDVFEIDNQEIELPPATLHGEMRELITGACKLRQRLLLLLNTERVLELTEAGT